MISKTYFFLIFLILLSCEHSTRKMSTRHVVLDHLQSDGISGSTVLNDYSRADMNSPLTQFKKYVDSCHFISDTARLHQLASYAYLDLRKTPFIRNKRGLVNYLHREKHVMGTKTVLQEGYGYYFVQNNSDDSYLHPDFGLEHWKLDTNQRSELPAMLSQWKERYHPMPFYSVVKGNHLYVLYTRSVQFDRYLRSFVNYLQENTAF